jgi:hypothetical protein
MVVLRLDCRTCTFGELIKEATQMRNVYIVYSNCRTFKVVVADSDIEAQEIAGVIEIRTG